MITSSSIVAGVDFVAVATMSRAAIGPDGLIADPAIREQLAAVLATLRERVSANRAG